MRQTIIYLLLSLASSTVSIPDLDPNDLCFELPSDTLPPLKRVNTVDQWKGNIYQDYQKLVNDIPDDLREMLSVSRYRVDVKGKKVRNM
jgi:hypothetical protein